MEQKLTINGHTMSYDDATTADGMRFLARINPQESKVFFDEAYNVGSALFEDHMGYKYKLTHKDSGYVLSKP